MRLPAGKLQCRYAGNNSRLKGGDRFLVGEISAEASFDAGSVTVMPSSLGSMMLAGALAGSVMTSHVLRQDLG